MLIDTPVDRISFYKRALLTWLLFIPTAVANGFIRQAVIQKITGELTAHQLSVLTGSSAFVVVGYFMLRRHVSLVSNNRLLLVGFTWMIMTIVFEFAMGRYISHLSWDTMFTDYNLLQGRLWILVLMTIAVIPWLVKKTTKPVVLDATGKAKPVDGEAAAAS